MEHPLWLPLFYDVLIGLLRKAACFHRAWFIASENTPEQQKAGPMDRLCQALDALRRQILRRSEKFDPVSVVQFSCSGETSAQLTRDWVLRTSEVMLISTSVGEVLV